MLCDYGYSTSSFYRKLVIEFGRWFELQIDFLIILADGANNQCDMFSEESSSIVQFSLICHLVQPSVEFFDFSSTSDFDCTCHRFAPNSFIRPFDKYKHIRFTDSS